MVFKYKSFDPFVESKLKFQFEIMHQKVLSMHGIKRVDTKHYNHKNQSICFAAFGPNHEMVAGLKIIIKSFENLPVERYLKNQSIKILEYVKILEDQGIVAELCGLWVHPNYRKMDLPYNLSIFAIGNAKSLNINVMLNFYSKFTNDLVVNRLGFVQVKNLENNGVFPFPNSEYESFVAVKSIL